MRSVCHAALASVGLLSLMSGCYHYGYSPYGYGGYPGPASYPVAPGGTYMGPSQTQPYVPFNSTTPGASPTPLTTPNGTSTTPGGGAPAWRPDPNSAPGGVYEPPDRTVPNPTNDPNNINEPFGPNPNNTGITPPFSPFASGVQLQPMIETAPGLSPGAAAPTGTIVSSDPFAPAMRPVSNGATVTAKPTKHSGDGKRPFGYDTRNYSWLRGYVDFDPKDQRWIIIYSATPESSDRFGGSLTLHDHQLLALVKPQDHVLIDGRLDEASFDQHGKPLYRIDNIKRLK